MAWQTIEERIEGNKMTFRQNRKAVTKYLENFQIIKINTIV